MRENYFLSASYLSEIGVTGRKNDFFGFFSCCKSTHRDETYCFHPNFISSAFQRSHGGGQKNVNFRLKMTPQAEKKTFVGFFFSCCTSTHWVKTFFILSRFHIFSHSEISWGGGKNALQQTTTNNKWAPRTIIIPVTIRKIIGLIMIVFFLCFNPKVKLCKETRRNAKIR